MASTVLEFSTQPIELRRAVYETTSAEITGETVRDIQIPSSILHSVVSCIYNAPTRSFCLALSGSSILIIPVQCNQIALLEQIHVPLQPRKLENSIGSNFFICCDGSLSYSCSCSEPSIVSDELVSNASINGYTFFDSAVDKNKFSMMSISTVPAQLLSIQTWSLSTVDTNKWLPRKSTTITELNIDGHVVVAASADHDCNSFNVALLQNSSPSSKKSSKKLSSADLDSKSFRWLKVSMGGSVLFDRRIQGVTSAAIGRGHMIAFILHQYISVWDVRYGTPLYEVPIPTSVGSTVPRLAIFLHSPTVISCNAVGGHSFSLQWSALPAATAAPSLAQALGQLGTGASTDIIIPPHHPTSSSSVPPMDEAELAASASGKILSALPAVFKRKLVKAQKLYDVQMQAEAMLFEDEIAGSKRKVASSSSSISGSNSSSMGTAKGGLNVDDEGEEVDDSCSGVNQRLKQRRFYLDIDTDATEAFLRRFHDVASGCLQALTHTSSHNKRQGSNSKVDLQALSKPLVSDWEIVNVLLRAGTVSLKKNYTIVPTAAVCGRADTLIHAARYAPDLTEKQALQIISHCAGISEDSLSKLSVCGGALRWSSKGGAATPTGETHESAEASTAAAATSKGKKGAKSKSGPVPETVPEPTPTEAGGSEVKSPLTLVGLAIEALLLRDSSFSSVLLSDAIRAVLSAQASALLLRLLIHSLRGLSVALPRRLQSNPAANATTTAGADGSGETGSKKAKKKKSAGAGLDADETAAEVGGSKICGSLSTDLDLHISPFRDEQARRAIMWAEAILDAHFTATALNAMSHPPTQRALACAMEVAAPAEDASEAVGKTLGVLSHILRMNRTGANSVPSGPPGSIYSIDHLFL